jgi:hypothetical protein
VEGAFITISPSASSVPSPHGSASLLLDCEIAACLLPIHCPPPPTVGGRTEDCSPKLSSHRPMHLSSMPSKAQLEGALPSKDGLVGDATAVLPMAIKLLPVRTCFAAFVVVVLGIRSGNVAFVLLLLPCSSTPLPHNLVILSMLEVGRMLWPCLLQKGPMLHCKFLLTPILELTWMSTHVLLVVVVAAPCMACPLQASIPCLGL